MARNQFYSRRPWRELREYVLSQNPICVMCQSRGLTVLAEEVDHIVPMSKGGEPYDLDNLQPLCKSCHSRKTAVDDGRRQYVSGCDANGFPLDPAHPFNKGA